MYARLTFHLTLVIRCTTVVLGPMKLICVSLEFAMLMVMETMANVLGMLMCKKVRYAEMILIAKHLKIL